MDHDFKTLQRRDRDGYENWLTTLFEHTIGKPAIVNLSIAFEDINGQDVCRIDVDPSPSPVFVERRDESWFYVRLNNSTRRLNTKEALEYIRARWGGSEGSEMGSSGPPIEEPRGHAFPSLGR